ncbi:MAG: TetR/AcrR family transcriptional regulator [Desulfobacteraceae bacterium]|nr:MAG: TetR/AcrR family transcriptional regulator [Desulfobacteraceae bacterium]
MTKKAAILQCATGLFAMKGYKETSMAELAKVAEIAQGTIFYHYGTKEVLFLSILQAFKEDLSAEFESHFNSATSRNGLEMVEDVISFYFNIADKMQDRFLLLHRHDAYELAQGNPLCREHLEAIYTCLVDMFEKAIVTGQRDGSITSLPARKVALIIFTMVDSLVRFNTYRLYSAGTLANELISACRAILKHYTG